MLLSLSVFASVCIICLVIVGGIFGVVSVLRSFLLLVLLFGVGVWVATLHDEIPCNMLSSHM